MSTALVTSVHSHGPWKPWRSTILTRVPRDHDAGFDVYSGGGFLVAESMQPRDAIRACAAFNATLMMPDEALDANAPWVCAAMLRDFVRHLKAGRWDYAFVTDAEQVKKAEALLVSLGVNP